MVESCSWVMMDSFQHIHSILLSQFFHHLLCLFLEMSVNTPQNIYIWNWNFPYKIYKVMILFRVWYDNKPCPQLFQPHHQREPNQIQPKSSTPSLSTVNFHMNKNIKTIVTRIIQIYPMIWKTTWVFASSRSM